ncbi:hypothetical protein Gotur_025554 [Gossypium turneri]
MRKPYKSVKQDVARRQKERLKGTSAVMKVVRSRGQCGSDVKKWPGTDGKMTLGLHFLDLESDEVFIRAMPPDAPLSPLPLPDLERGWRKTTTMLFPRAFLPVLAAEGKIYVVELLGFESFGEVYDISGDIWEPLSPPPKAIALYGPVLLDSPRSRILVLFTLITMIFCSLEAYNLLDKKHLPVKWSQEFSVDPPRSGTLFRLGNGKCILRWVSYNDMSFEYIRFNTWCNEQGGIHAAAEHQSAITVPYRSKDICDIFLF